MNAIHESPPASNSAAALYYALKGWHVFPCWPDQKIPMTANGHLNASNDPEQVAAWWRANPSANIGLNLAASGLVVVDADLYKPGVVLPEGLPDTLTASTARGGKHFIFTAPAGADYAGTLGPGVDIKHNGYVMLNPSTFEGKEYRWDNSARPALAPDWLPRKGAAGKRKPLGQGVQAPNFVTALITLHANDPNQLGYEEWRNAAMGFRGATALLVPEPVARAKFDKWCDRYAANDPVANEKLWRSIDGGTSKDWNSLFWQTHGAPPPADPVTLFGGHQYALPPGATPEPVAPGMTQPPAINEAEWNDTGALTPTCIVENLYFADLGVRVAPGGVGKTTLALYEAMHIALGWPLFGCPTRRPGLTCILRSEDQRGMLVQRLRKLCEAENLTAEQVATVRQNVRIQYVEQFKLTVVQGDIVVASDGVRQVIEAFGPLRPSIIWIDPAVSFSVGESRVNDAEQGLVTAGRMIRNAIPDCAVMFIHHTGKANAREGTLDQYSGRNGSALPDGSRMVQVMKSLTPDEWREATGDTLGLDETAFVIARPKLSYVPQQPHIYVKRSGWAFVTFGGQSVTNKSERAKTVTMTLLRKRWARGDEVAKYRAHAELERDPDAAGIRKITFEEAINGLLNDKILQITENKRGSAIIVEASAS